MLGMPHHTSSSFLVSFSKILQMQLDALLYRQRDYESVWLSYRISVNKRG